MRQNFNNHLITSLLIKGFPLFCSLAQRGTKMTLVYFPSRTVHFSFPRHVFFSKHLKAMQWLLFDVIHPFETRE